VNTGGLRKSITAMLRVQSHRAIDHFVFLITCAFLVPPFAAWLIRSTGEGREDTAYTTFAPFAAGTVLVILLLLLEFVERRVAGTRPGWPPALFELPVVCIAAALAFSAVDPGHHWWRDGLAGAAWGTAAALWGWRRWRARTGATE
jgi:hypothetical protein